MIGVSTQRPGHSFHSVCPRAWIRASKWKSPPLSPTYWLCPGWAKGSALLCWSRWADPAGPSPLLAALCFKSGRCLALGLRRSDLLCQKNLSVLGWGHECLLKRRSRCQKSQPCRPHWYSWPHFWSSLSSAQSKAWCFPSGCDPCDLRQWPRSCRRQRTFH